MTTVTIRLMVVTAFSQGTRVELEVLRDEVEGYIAIIGKVFTKRWQGLRCLTQLTAQQRDDFATYGRFPMAAADIYGGDYIGGIFYPSAVTRSNFDPWLAPGDFWDFRTSGRPVDLTWTDHNAKRFGEHWWNQLYLSTGLEALFLYLTQLRVICDAPWFPTRLTELERRIRDVLTDQQKAKKARLAAHLSASIESLEPSERAILTQSIYDAMDRGGERSDEIIRNSVKQLQRLL
jgi:hypothetical protein